MKFFSLLTLLIVLLEISSCSDPVNIASDNSLIVVSPDQIHEEISVEAIFSSVDAIKLNLPQGEDVGNVIKVFNLKGKWFLLHQQTGSPERVVTVVSEQGEFEYSLRYAEEEPESYMIEDLAPVSEDAFAVLERTGKRLFYYDTAGKLFDQKSLPFKVTSFRYLLADNQYVFNRNSRSNNHEDTSLFYNLIFTDELFSIQSKYFPYEIPVGGRSIVNFPAPILKGGGKVYFSELFSDELSAFKAGIRISEETISFDLPGANKDIHGDELNQMEQVQKRVNDGGIILAGRFAVEPQKRLVYFNLASAESPIFGLSTNFGENLYLAKQLLRPDGGVLPYPVAFDSKFGFISVLNEHSLEYTPDEFLVGKLIEDVLSDGACYLMYSTLK